MNEFEAAIKKWFGKTKAKSFSLVSNAFLLFIAKEIGKPMTNKHEKQTLNYIREKCNDLANEGLILKYRDKYLVFERNYPLYDEVILNDKQYYTPISGIGTIISKSKNNKFLFAQTVPNGNYLIVDPEYLRLKNHVEFYLLNPE